MLVIQKATLLDLQACIVLLSDEDEATLKSFKVASKYNIEARGEMNVTSVLKKNSFTMTPSGEKAFSKDKTLTFQG